MYEAISKESKSYNDYLNLIKFLDSYSEDEKKEIKHLTSIGFNSYKKGNIYKKFATPEGINQQIIDSENETLFVFYIGIKKCFNENTYFVTKQSFTK